MVHLEFRPGCKHAAKEGSLWGSPPLAQCGPAFFHMLGVCCIRVETLFWVKAVLSIKVRSYWTGEEIQGFGKSVVTLGGLLKGSFACRKLTSMISRATWAQAPCPTGGSRWSSVGA
jgi:hypothetical protein